MTDPAEVERQYAAAALRERPPGMDELHVRGRDATAELAELAALEPGERVLDVGSGLGGPARTLAAERGVDVVGVDLTEAFVERARVLTREAGLEERVSFVHADALRLPFEDRAFDVVWTQHAAMNVADREGLYRELRRVVRRDGRLALYDVIRGPSPREPDFPLPWASHPGLSHLVTEEELERLLLAAALVPLRRRDATAAGLEWATANAAQLGPAFEHLGLALGDGRLRLLQLVAVAR